MIWQEVLGILYLFIPAYVANLSPIFLKKVPYLSRPLDGGRTIRSRRVFGENKTVRGLLGGVIFGTIAFVIQQVFFGYGLSIYPIVDYGSVSWILGSIIAFAAIGGDALESFVKRQLDIGPGQAFVPWDQLDFVIASGLVTIPIWISFWPAMLVYVLIIFALDVLCQKIGYWAGLKKDPL